MEDRDHESGQECSISGQMEAPMETNMEAQRVQPTNQIRPAGTCSHSRVLDDVLTRSGKRTGKVRCLECGSTIDDPSQDLK
jgi:hypothetical protein